MARYKVNKVRREIPDFLKGIFTDPSQINWAFVDAYERIIKDFMRDNGEKFCQFIKQKTGVDVLLSEDGKIYGNEEGKNFDFEKLMAEFLLSNM